MTKTLLGAGTLACALLTSTALTSPAFAQAPQPYRTPDANGVDVVHGDYLMEVLEGSIGSGVAELQLIRTGTWLGGGINLNGHQWDRIGFQKLQTPSGPHYIVTVGSRSEVFGDTWTLPSGSSLTGSFNSFDYRIADGTTISFGDVGQGGWGTDSNLCTIDPNQGDCILVPTAISEPSGRTVTLDYDFRTECWGVIDSETLPCRFYPRISQVANSSGYMIGFAYNTSGGGGGTPPASWYQRTGATFHNIAVSGNPAQSSVGYAYPSTGVTEVTDMGGRVWRFTGTSTGMTGIRRPGASSDTTTIAYTSGRVSSVVNEGVTTTYARSVSGSTGTMTITAVDGDSGTTDPVTTVVSNLTIGRPTSITDPLSRTTGFQYDSSARLTRVTRPEGNYVAYGYDARGNLTETRAVAKAGSGLADMVTTASYDGSCANPVKCNSPNSTTDARGNITDYSYDPTHGGVTSVTAPAPSGSGTQPQTRYTYALANGVYRLTESSVCATGSDPSCVGTADETRTVLTHDANGNLTSVEQRSGNTSGAGALSATTAMTYDARGDLLTVDGPLPGTADTGRLRYNAARQRVGAIGPDPDGANPLKHRAVRITYANGLPTRQETGTVNSQSDGDWAAFAGLEEVQQSYDANARPTVSRLVSGSTTYALSQTSYDGLGRVRCTAQRMNPAEFASLPSDACTLDTQGSHGPDRIARTSYDLAGQATRVETGVGVSGVAADEAATSYRANGQLETLTDANGNMTTYVFDGHDRLVRTRMPAPSTPGTSSTTDYEELTYLTPTVAGQVRSTPLIASRRLRDGTSIAYGYDALGRLTSNDPPGTAPTVSYGYDLLGRPVTVAQYALGHTLSFTHDALGRLSSQSGAHGSISYDYDLAGRRTKMTWPDSFWVGYDYLVTGEVSAIRENGGAVVLGSYGYDNLGRRTSISRYNGTSTSFDYDPVSRLDELVQNLTGTSSDLTLNFTHNPASQIASNTRSNDAFSFTGHANLNQVGTPNGLNQLTAVAGTSISHWRGNVAAIGSASYNYSAENRLTHGPGSSAFTFDPLGRLYASYSPALGATYFQSDGQSLVTEYGSGAVLLRRYVHGPGVDDLLVWYEGSGTGTRRWFHQDERGSVIAVSDASG
ncbi:MAG TPA: hypothetical protein VEX35_05175, partial [Allosphingosinicella sp.]|nr:hypothetical protein [Allosphingosinicella sp.]